MNLYQFNFFPIDQRAQLTWEHGSFVAIRHKGDSSIVLYHMGEFFAEVWYSTSENRISLVRGFKSQRLLEPYLDQVDLAELMGEG